MFLFHATLEICTLYFAIHFVHKKQNNANILVYKVNGNIMGADLKGSMKRKHPNYDETQSGDSLRVNTRGRHS